MKVGDRFLRVGVRVGLMLCGLLLAGGATAGAQQAGAPQDLSPAARGSIVLDVVVTPKSGQGPVAGLTQQDFTVLDNKAPRPITSFRALGGSEAPVEVLVVIDAVNVGYQTIGYERGEIEKFLHANGGHLAFPTSLAVVTDTKTQLENGFSTDGSVLNGVLDKAVIGLRSLPRSAGYYGAVDRLQLSLKALNMLAAEESRRPGRKLIVWVSPGWPMLSGPNTDLTYGQEKQIFDDIVGVSTRLREAGITLYSIDPLGTNDAGMRTFYYRSFLKGVSKPSQVSIGNLGLPVLATQSGGLALNSSNDLTAELRECAEDAKAYYRISFDAPVSDRPDEYHQLEIRVAKPGLVARTWQGYYAQPLAR